MSRFWSGPWIGKVTGTPDPPTPSGDFTIEIASIDYCDWWESVPGVSAGYIFSLSMFGADHTIAVPLASTLWVKANGQLLIDGVLTAIGDVPAGFTVLSAQVNVEPSLLSTSGDNTATFALCFNATGAASANPSPFAYPAALPSIADLLAEGFGVCGVSTAGSQAIVQKLSDTPYGGVWVSGTYEIV